MPFPSRKPKLETRSGMSNRLNQKKKHHWFPSFQFSRGRISIEYGQYLVGEYSSSKESKSLNGKLESWKMNQIILKVQ